MIIGDLNPMGIRQDKGNLWENFLIAERLSTILIRVLWPKAISGEQYHNKRLIMLRKRHIISKLLKSNGIRKVK